MSKGSDLLFYGGDLFKSLRHQHEEISEKVDAISKDQFLTTPEDDLLDHIYDTVHIEPIVLYEDRMEMEQNEVKVDVRDDIKRIVFDEGPLYVDGVQVVVKVPYTGHPELWTLKPNSLQTVFPHAKVCQPDSKGVGYIEIVLEQPVDEPLETIKQRLESELKSIRFYLDQQKCQVEDFNSNASEEIRKAIKARKERLKIHDGISEMLGIPLTRREDTPSIGPIPIKRKLVRPLPPTQSGFKAEPGIYNEDYEHILKVIKHVGRTFETTPKTYAVHDEEELRDILLAHLNGHYEGGATGETFRCKGKTDIRIEDQDRAAFIAECKVWEGQKKLTEAIDQLLGYLTWRDCKASIVIFNKRIAGFTELLKKIPETLLSHTGFKKDLGQKGNGEWRFIFKSNEDELRQIIVHTFVFNLYVADTDC